MSAAIYVSYEVIRVIGILETIIGAVTVLREGWTAFRTSVLETNESLGEWILWAEAWKSTLSGFMPLWRWGAVSLALILAITGLTSDEDDGGSSNDGESTTSSKRSGTAQSGQDRVDMMGNSLLP